MPPTSPHRVQFQPRRLCLIALDHSYKGRAGRYITLAPHVYRDGYLGTTITVPRGFRTDFASFPRAVWWLLEREGPWARAALFHDWLYRTQQTSRDEADSIFKFMMLHDIDQGTTPAAWCTAKLLRGLFYVLLVVFGGWAWRANEKRLAASGGVLDTYNDTELVDAECVIVRVFPAPYDEAQLVDDEDPPSSPPAPPTRPAG